MSLLVSRRKYRRKLPHQPKNLDDVLFIHQSSSSKTHKDYSSDNNYPQVSRRSSNRTSHYHQRHRSGSPVASSSSATLLSSTINSTKERGLFQEEDFDLESISFRIGQITYEMDNMGTWTSYSSSSLTLDGGGESRGSFPLNFKESIADLSDMNKRIAQENNLLRVKNEVLIDMVARKTLRKHTLEAELKRLRRLLSSSSSRFSISSEK